MISTVTAFERDPLEISETADYVIINGDEGIVEVIKKNTEYQPQGEGFIEQKEWRIWHEGSSSL